MNFYWKKQNETHRLTFAKSYTNAVCDLTVAIHESGDFWMAMVRLDGTLMHMSEHASLHLAKEGALKAWRRAIRLRGDSGWEVQIG